MEDLTKNIYSLYRDKDTSPSQKEIEDTLLMYASNPNDWMKYVSWNDHRYTRNLVDKGNGKFNMIILCWGPGQGSPIHDHSGSHCFVKVLAGQLQESLYTLPQAGETCSEEGCEMQRVDQPVVYEKDQVTYIHDDMGVAHRMENPSHTEGCVTLHLYTPPYASCHKFDDRTRTAVTVSMSYDQDFSDTAPSCKGVQGADGNSCCVNK